MICFACLFITASVMAGETEPAGGVISGKITTAEGLPAADVMVRVRGTDRISITDDDGNFVFRRMLPGTYEVEVSLTGYATVRRQVTVTGDRNAQLTLQLQVSGKQLQEVIVTGNRARFTRTASETSAKTMLKNLENPQVYNTITKELIADQMLFTADDAMKNAPGVQKMWEATNRSGDGGAYYNARGFILQSKLRNGVAGNVSSTIDAANLESIDVIKGPSATLFGSSLTSYGGLINRVTKKPFDRFGGEAAFATGSYGFNRISADVNTPLDAEKNLLFRINTAYTSEGSFQDNGFSKGYALAPSITYRVNERLSFSVDAEMFGGSNSSKQMVFFYFPVTQLNAVNPAQLGIDYKRSYSDPGIFQTYQNNNLFAQMKYILSPHWTSQTNFTATHSFSDGPYAYLYVVPNSVATGNASATGADYLQRADQSTSNNTDDVTEIQQNFSGDLNIGGMRHRFVGGLDYFTDRSNQLFYGANFDLVRKNGNIPTYGRFNRENLNRVLADTNAVWTYPYYFKNSVYSAYASDIINLTDRLIAMAAVRIDHFDNKGNLNSATGEYSGGYQQTAVSPKFGLVYQPWKDRISLFANYQNGFTNQNGTDAKGNTFKPEQANQVEGGIKTSLRGFTATVSYYYIKVKDVVRPDQANPSFSVQDGTQVSKGFEADISARPAEGLNILAGFAYNDSKLEKAAGDVEGRRPATAMSPVTGNLWISYRVPAGKAKGLGFGFGGNYAGENKILNSVYYGVFTLPAYTVLNASVSYDQPKFRVGVKVDNLTNQEYWIGYTTMNPQKLRSVTASIAFKF